MAGPLDHQFGIGNESTYGTPVTPTAFYEWDMSGSTHRWDPRVVQGTGMQPGDGGVDRASRSVAVVGQASGTVALDYQSRGMGLLIDSFFGTGASALVSGTTYQQLFTSNLTAGLLPARTLEYGVVRADAAGTVDAYRYAGCTGTRLTIACETGGIVTATAEWDGRSQARTTSPATASYPSGLGAPFHFGQIAATFGGTLTLPTSTALGSGGTTAPNMRSFSFAWDNQPDTGDWAFGGTRNQPSVRKRVGTLTMNARYDVATYDDALVNHTTVPVMLTATKTDEALSTGFATLQLVFPACKIDPSDRPAPGLETPATELTMRVLKPDTGHAVYIVHRTASTSL